MEVTKYLNILKKHKYGIISIPILVMILTFFLVRKLPDTYSSRARLSAGITEKSQQLLQNANDLGELKINQNFSNLIQTMQLKIVLDEVSYQLILHDLTSNEPFKEPSKLLGYVNANPSAKAHAIDVFSKFYQQRQGLSLFEKDQKGLNDLLASMGYDYESLKKKINIHRVENSDFIDVDYESEKALLSAFVVNTFTKEFISYYGFFTQENERKSIDYLAEVMTLKKDSLNREMEALKNYKIEKRVLNLNDQAKILYGEIADFETQLGIAQKEVDANTGAISEIDSKFTDNEKQYKTSRESQINKEILADQELLNSLNDKYIKSNFDENIKLKINSLKNSLNQKINQSADKDIANPLSAKNDLINEKLRLEIELGLAKSSINSLKEVIEALNKRLDEMVPNEAVIQAYESAIDVDSKEYIELLKKYNQSNIDYNNSVQIKVIEAALPGAKGSSKKLVLVIMSGAVSAILYLFILFILYYLDNSIKIPNDLDVKTNTPVLGYLTVVKSSFLDIQKLWNIDPMNNEFKKLIRSTKIDLQKITRKKSINLSNIAFKKLLRSTRFEINMAMMGSRNLVITSLMRGEGKTLLSLSLVSAYQMMNKKVLLIDGNFLNPGITAITHPKYYIEDYLTGNTSLNDLMDAGNITVLGNKGNDISLFEINNPYEVEQKLLELKDIFDFIIIEASALNTLNQSKEWIVVGDRVLCMFEANTSITFEKKGQIEYLKSLEGKFIGWVLNKVDENDNYKKSKT